MALEDVLKQMKSDQDAQMGLSSSAMQSVKINPDQQGAAVKLSRQSGMPVNVFPEMSDDAKLSVLVNNFRNLQETSPKTANFMSDPQNAALAHDDTENMSLFESVINKARSTWQDTKQGFSELGTAFRRAGPGFTKSMSGTSYFLDKLTKPYNTTGGTPDDTSIYAQTPEEWQNRETAARETQAPAVSKLEAPDMQYTERSAMGHSPLLFAATRFIENAPTQIPMIGGGIIAGLGAPHIGIPLVVAGTGLAFGAEGSDAYDEVVKKTGDENLALLAGIGNGTVEIADGFFDMVGGSLFAGKSLFKAAAKKELADRLVGGYIKNATGSAAVKAAVTTAKGTAFEGLTEGVQGVAQQFIPNVATGESSTPLEYVTTFAENALPGAFGGAILGAPSASHKAYNDQKNARFIVSSLTDPTASNEDKVKAMGMAYSDMREMAMKGETVPPPSVAARSILAGMIAGDSNFATQADNALQAHSNAQALDTMAELAKANKVIPRDEETARVFFQSLRTEGVNDVAIPVERFVEHFTAQGLDAMAEAERITGNSEALNDAIATGGDFHIPVESLITKVLTTDAYSGLRDDIRLHPDDWTAREAKEWETSQAAQDFQTSLESMQKADPVQAVYQSVMGELLGAKIPRGQAEIQAQLWADRYRTRAGRLGVDPHELYQRDKGITVTRPIDPILAERTQSDPQFDSKLDAIRNDQIPKQGEIFGKSLIDFVREHGVKDDRGDLAAMEIDKTGAKFKKNVIRDDGMSLDKVRELAVEAGYFPQGADTTVFLDAISNELQGNPTFSNMNIKQDVMDKAHELEQLRQGLEHAGIDLNQMDNAGVRQVLNQGSTEGALFQDDIQPAYAKTTTQIADSYLSVRDSRLKVAGFEVDTYTMPHFLEPRLVVSVSQVSKDGKSVMLISRIISGKTIYLDNVMSVLPKNERSGVLEPLYKAESDIANKYGLTIRADISNDEVTGKLFRKFYPQFTVDVNNPMTHRASHETTSQSAPIGSGTTARLNGSKYFNRQEELNYFQSNPSDQRGSSKNDAGRSGRLDTLFQPGNTPRGYFKPSLREIGLLKDANLSTFLHETGHAWLEELRLDSQTEGVDQQVVSDWNTVKEWLGITSDTNEITTAQHEQFARGFESYLSEGKSPSNALNDAFRRFAGWLKQVYSDLSRLDVKLTPEVRQVMDRLIASEEEIKSARERQGLTAEIFATAEDAGMTEDEFKLYRKAAEKEHATAVERLESQLMKELKREHATWWKEERAKLREEVEAEAKDQPVYQVSHLLLKGQLFDGTEFENTIKLNKAELVRMYGEKFPGTLPKGFGTVMYAEDGMSIDMVAGQFGFTSGDEMIRAIVDAPKMKAWIDAETDHRMRQAHGDMLMDGTIAEEAMNAVHNDRRGEIMLKEMAAIRRKQNAVKPFVNAAVKEIKQGAKSLETPPLAAYKDAAKTIIGNKPVEDLSPIYFSRTEKKAGDEAIKLFKKGDYEGAQRAKEQQVLNHYLYIEAVKARQEAEKIRNYAVKMMTKDSLGKLGKAGNDFLQQVRTILEAHGFERVSGTELNARVESLDRFLARMRDEENIDIPVDPDLLAGALPNYKRMTIDELRAMYDTVKSLEKVAGFINSIRIKGERIAFEQLETEAVNSINELWAEHRPVNRTHYDKTWLQEKWDGIKNLTFGIMRPQALIEALDGDSHDQQGIFHDALWTPYNEASAHENNIKARLLPQINEILDSNPKSAERYRTQFKIESLGESMSVYTMIGIVLNMGNASNMDKLMRGGLMQGQQHIEISPAAIDEIIGHLTKSEMDMIQGMWDMVETLKPEMRALEQRMYGIEPEWVEAQELATKHGVYRGGYWPVVYDSDFSKAGQKQEDAATISEALSVMPFSQAFTKHGHLKSRTKAAFPMLFDWQQVASRHLDQVITDIAYREFIITSSKVLRSQDIKNAIIDRMGNGYHTELNAWLKGIVDREQSMSKADSQLLALRNAARTNATVAYLGLKVANAIVDTIVTPMQAWSRVDALSLATGIKGALTNYSKNKEQIQEMSPYMAHLWMNIDRDLSDGMKQLAGKSGVLDQIKLVSMESRSWAYELGAMMIWKGAFLDAQKNHGLSGIEAVQYADDVVRGTSDAGRKGDLNAWERSKNLKEFTMFMGPMTIAVNQIAKAARVGKRQGWTKTSMPFKTLVGIWLSNGLLYELLLNRGPDADDDKEKWLKWAMAKFAMFPVQALPVIRDLGSMVENKAQGEPSSARGVPVYETGKALWNAAAASYKYLDEGEDGGKAIKNINMAAGLAVGLPASQLNITGQYIADQLSGDYDPKHVWSPVQDIFFRRKKEK